MNKTIDNYDQVKGQNYETPPTQQEIIKAEYLQINGFIDIFASKNIKD